mgnify:CR=1 FL=1
MKGLVKMPKVFLTEEAKRTDKLAKRMDRFDAVVNEYLRANNYTTSDLAFQLGTTTTSLWRYRNKVDSFEKAPFEVVTHALALANCPSETLRFICGM